VISVSADSLGLRNAADADKQTGCLVPTMVLSETFRLSLFLVVRGGIDPRTKASGEPTAFAEMNPGRDASQTLKLLAVSDVQRRNGLSPFFQTIKVIAAIVRARVRRAIVGFIPLAVKAA
jgi:hypothetical protein